jgi:hypothetical protein
MPDDGSLAAGQLTSREFVTKAVTLLRENYVFPDQAERVATEIEARLAASEYDNLDEITLTELLTDHLQAASGDKHLRVLLGGGPPARGNGPAPRHPEPGRDSPGPRPDLGGLAVRAGVGDQDLVVVEMPASRSASTVSSATSPSSPATTSCRSSLSVPPDSSNRRTKNPST